MEYLPKIILTKGNGAQKYTLYEKWLKAAGSVGCVLDLWTMSSEERSHAIATSDGIIFTGGPDINPEKYNQAERSGECIISDERDAIEFEAFEQARDFKMPILGICRGLQIFNVALEAQLIIDIPRDILSDIEHRSIEGNDSFHTIEVAPGSLIKKICRSASGLVNSAHHQAVAILSEQLSLAGSSSDGIIEAAEWSDPGGKGFLLGVQWHPERLDYSSPFSLPIARHFLFEAESYALLRKRRIKVKA